MMKRRAFLASACALPLAGCGNVLGPGDSLQIYMLHPDFPAAPAGAKVSWALSVMRPDTMDSLDTTRIPLVHADGTLDFYAKAQFPGRITDLVQDTLVAGFEASGRIDEVSTQQNALHVDYDLLTDILDFQAQYNEPDGVPTAQVTLSCKLVAVRGRKIIGGFTTRQSVPASVNSVGSATLALQSALAAAAKAVVGWALAIPAPKA